MIHIQNSLYNIRLLHYKAFAVVNYKLYFQKSKNDIKT